TGRNLIKVARRYPLAQLYGIDISRMMLETAQTDIDRAGLGARISLAQGDACAFAPEALFGRALFDRVYFSYTLSMIPDWQAALEMALRAVAPGGSLHIVDFGQQTLLPHGFKRVLHAWLAKFDVMPVAELEPALIRLAHAHHGHLTLRRPLRDYAVLGHLQLR
ncbi:MAG: methyltransferase domain-containing protein, partial [Alphaproteobacteria bacterium]|nr:methyltransferase domain-containing protein [Alphaproteobacteria bacterium]